MSGNGSVPDAPRVPVRFGGGEIAAGAGDAVGRSRRVTGQPLAVQLLREAEVSPRRRPGEGQKPPVTLPLQAEGRAPKGLVRVQALSTDQAIELGFSGLAFVVEPDAEMVADAGALWTRFEIDWSELLQNYGADWHARIGVLAFDPCRLAARDFCESPSISVPTVFNDVERKTLVVEVDLRELRAEIDANGVSARRVTVGSSGRPRVSSTGGAGFGLTTSASSVYGNLGATSLQAAGKWSVSGNTGGFSWSYPIPLTSVPAGPTPSVSLDYSSQAVDGMTADENTQGGPIGVGWSMPQAFIERRYKACARDGGGAGNGGFCWSGDNAVLSLNGQNGELSRDAAGVWRLENDPGWRISRYQNTTDVRGSEGVDSNAEYWVVTTQDGSQYWFGFGLEKGAGVDEPGNAGSPGTALKSVWTVPVVGNQAGEPCSALSGGGWCHQAYRWMLDRVVDSNGRVMTYQYETHVNAFSRDWTASGAGYLVTPYTSGGQLAAIEYGKLFNDAPTRTPEAKVLYGYTWRCDPAVGNVPNSTCNTAPTEATGENFPDIPADMICAATEATCEAKAPTFFDWKVLVNVRTQRLVTAGSASSLVTVETINLRPEWIDNDETDSLNSLKLWLRNVTRTGSQQWAAAGAPTTTSLVGPSVWFDSNSTARLANRANPNTWNPLAKYYRLSIVTDEIGGRTVVDYSSADPACATKGSGWDTNTLPCFVRWLSIDNPPSASGAATWNKYVVDSVTHHDMVRGQAAVTSTYTYDAGGMAWAHDDDPFATNTYWNEYRGYSSVTVTTGTGSDATKSTTRYFRGMHDDQIGTSGVNPVSLISGLNISYPDYEWLSGYVLESTIYNGADEVSTTFYDYINQRPEISGATTNGGNARMGGVNKSRRVGIEWTSTRTKTGASTYVYDKNQTLYDTAGRPDRQVRWGEVTLSGSTLTDVTAADNTCTKTQYTAVGTTDDDRFIEGLPFQLDTLGSSGCPAPSATASLARTVTLFDDMQAGLEPDRGNATTVTMFSADTVSYSTHTAYETSGFHATNPLYGRPSSVTAPSTELTNTVYAMVSPTNSENRHVRSVTTTNPLGHSAITEFDDFGRTRRTQDANGHAVHQCYDAFGRVTRGYYNPGSTVSCTAASPAVQFNYVSTLTPLTNPARDTYSWMIESRTLLATATDPYRPAGATTDTYAETDAFLDGFGRTVQSQSISPNSTAGAPKRIISATDFSDDGRVLREYVPYATTGEVGSSYVALPALTVLNVRHSANVYDGLGRTLRTEQRAGDGTNAGIVRAYHTTYDGLATTAHVPTTTATTPSATSVGSTTTTTNVLGQTISVAERNNTVVASNLTTTDITSTTTFTYTPLGALDKKTDPAGYVTDYDYDWLGRSAKSFDPNAGVRSYVYDSAGRVKCVTDARNVSVLTLYEDLDRPIGQWKLPNATCPAGSTPPAGSVRLTEFGYDTGTGAKGAVTKAVSFNETTGLAAVEALVDPTNGFDAFGRLSKYSVQVKAADDPALAGDDHLDGVVTFASVFTRTGAVYQTTYPAINGSWWQAETVTATFDVVGSQLGSSSDWEAAPGVASKYVGLTQFDDLGRVTRRDLGQVLTGTVHAKTEFAYRPSDGLLQSSKATRVPVSGAASVELFDSYVYDVSGNPVEVKHDPDGTSFDFSDCFGFDNRQ